MRLLWTLLFATVPVGGVIAFALAMTSKYGWLPENISTVGEDIDHLFYVILWVTAFFFVVTEVLLVYTLWTGRGKANGKASYTHGQHTLEISWTIMTALILLFVAFYQIPAWAKAKYASNKPNRNPDAIVTASQFMWQVRYPTWDEKANAPKKLNPIKPDLQDSFELNNELHVPVGEMVVVYLTTRDVIHSFWLVNARVKQDALPGNMIPVWFDAKKTGTFDWTCAELCGWGHYRMRGKMIVHTKEEYNQWLKDQTKAQTALKKP